MICLITSHHLVLRTLCPSSSAFLYWLPSCQDKHGMWNINFQSQFCYEGFYLQVVIPHKFCVQAHDRRWAHIYLKLEVAISPNTGVHFCCFSEFMLEALWLKYFCIGDEDAKTIGVKAWLSPHFIYETHYFHQISFGTLTSVRHIPTTC